MKVIKINTLPRRGAAGRIAALFFEASDHATETLKEKRSYLLKKKERKITLIQRLKGAGSE